MINISKQEKQTIVKAFVSEYRKSSKGQRGKILTQLESLTDYSRKHLMDILKNSAFRKKRIKRVRLSKYLVISKSLKQLWNISHFATGKRFVPLIPDLIDALERHNELRLRVKEKKLLLKISPATCDRLLTSERSKLKIKGRSYTKPGSLLKNQIPIKTWMDWDNSKPGFSEIDTVHHNGGNSKGEYIHTLDLTDVATAWNECCGLMGRGETGLVRALEEIRKRLPFSLLGIDFDSGGEFVNWHLVRYSDKHQITYTRAREGYSNDQPFIEQQNYSVVRTYVGYKRLDNPKQLELLNQLYLKLSDYQNFFQTVMRLKEKVRNGAHVKRTYSKAKTAYQRVLDHPDIPNEVKQKLKQRFLNLNPKQLLKEILKLSKKINS